MSVPQQIYNYLCAQSGPFCDDCIKEELKLANRQQVHQVTAALAVTPLFDRQHNLCRLCGRSKLVVQPKTAT